MPLINVSLEQDDPVWRKENSDKLITDPDIRRDGWSTEGITYQETPDDLPVRIYNFLENFIKPEFTDRSDQKPKQELVMMFTINKRILTKILDQDDCEGIRVFLSSKEGENVLTTNVDLKPVNSLLEELDVINSEREVLMCKTLTECPPPKNPCPKTRFNDFLELLKLNIL